MEFLDGVHAQPENLDRSREVVWSALLETDPGVLRYGTIAAVGMGASTHAAAAFAAELRARHRPAYPVSASELLGDRVDLADAYVGISFSGRSRETVEAFGRLTGSARLGLTNYPERAFGAAVDHVVPLGCGEDTRVSTLSYTATVQALGLLVERSTASATVEWSALPEQAAEVLKTAPADAIATAFGEVSSIDVIGSGHRYGSAGAASLLIREAAHTPTAAYETYEYLHGPLEVAAPGRGALVFGSGREIALAADLAGWGSPTVLVTDAEQLPDGLERDNLLVVRLPKLPAIAGCVLDILPVQLAVAELAERRGVRIALHHMPADTKLPESPAVSPAGSPLPGSGR